MYQSIAVRWIAPQLKLQQKAGLELQLKDQRDEAAKARRHAAMGDLVAAVERGLNRYRSLQSIEECFEDVWSALGRWSIEADDQPLMQELTHWPNLLYTTLREARIEQANDSPHPAPHERMITATSAIITTVTRWSRETPELRATMPEILSTIRGIQEEGSLQYRRGEHGDMESGMRNLNES